MAIFLDELRGKIWVMENAKDYRERYEELTDSSLWQCPVCRQGRMLVTQVLPRRRPRQVSIKDTS